MEVTRAVGQCGFWWNVDSDEWCDLAESACDCAGSQGKCPLDASVIAAARAEDQEMTLADAALRARRRRSAQEAS